MELSVDISKREGNFHLDVQLEAGDAPIALLGAAGCGKTLRGWRSRTGAASC